VRRLVPPKLCRAEEKIMTAVGTGGGAATSFEGTGTATVRDWPVYAGRVIVVVRADGEVWLGMDDIDCIPSEQEGSPVMVTVTVTSAIAEATSERPAKMMVGRMFVSGDALIYCLEQGYVMEW
jgi:hypothetical protein